MAKKMKTGKGFVWTATRIGFWVMIAFWLVSVPMMYFIDLESILYQLYSLIWFGVTIFTFVNSIIHLTKYKEKGLAVTALVISSIITLVFLVGVVIGIAIILS